MIKNLKELTDFLKICRKQGVNEIKFEGIAVSFGDLPRKGRHGEDTEVEGTEIPTEEPTDEEITFFSAGGAAPLNENN